MKFDGIFFDSGDTIYNNASLGPIAEPTPAQVNSAAPARTAAALNALGYMAREEDVARQLAALKGPTRDRWGDGYNEEKLVEALCQTLELPTGPEEILYLTGAFSGPRYRSWLFPHIDPVLVQLQAAGLYLGLIANTHVPGWVMDRNFKGVGLLSFFRTRIYSGDEGVAKPDPAIFHLAAERAGLTNANLLYVGNNVAADIEGARRADWQAALLRSTDSSSGGQAHFEFDDWHQLPAFALGS